MALKTLMNARMRHFSSSVAAKLARLSRRRLRRLNQISTGLRLSHAWAYRRTGRGGSRPPGTPGGQPCRAGCRTCLAGPGRPGRRTVRRTGGWVHDEHPSHAGIGGDGGAEVVDAIRRGAGVPDGGADALAGGDLVVAIRAWVPCRRYSNSRRSSLPGAAGGSGWTRSRAWMPVFSSVPTRWTPRSSNARA